ncbi:MAG: carboxypeptidase regulatory-like domain-containing protein [Pirellulaceae bacterium]
MPKTRIGVEEMFQLIRSLTIAILTFVLMGLGSSNATAKILQDESGVAGRYWIDADGKFVAFVAGATIEIRSGAGSVAANATSQADGSFKIPLPPGRYTYSVTAEGYQDEDEGRGFDVARSGGYSMFNFSLTQGKTDPNQPAFEHPPATVGQFFADVVDKDSQQSINNATIRLRRIDSRDLRTITPVRNDQATEYRLSDLPAGDWQASVVAPGYERVVAESHPIQIQENEETKYVFEMSPVTREMASEIRGSVALIPETPAPAEGFMITVEVYSLLDSAMFRGEQTPINSTQVRLGEEFAFDLAPGQYRVMARADGCVNTMTAPIGLGVGSHRNVNLRLRRKLEPSADAIAGREESQPADTSEQTMSSGIIVRVSTGKEPLAGATVAARSLADLRSSPIEALTDDQGMAKLSTGPGDFVVVVSKAGFEIDSASPAEFYSHGRLILTVPESGAAQAAFNMRELAIIAQPGEIILDVSDAQKKSPVPNANIELVDSTGKTWMETTSSTGIVTLSGVASGPITVRVSHPDYVTIYRGSQFDPTVPRHSFPLQRIASPASCNVHLYDVVDDSGISQGQVTLIDSTGSSRSVTTDNRGGAVFVDVAAGRYSLKASHPKYQSQLRSIEFTPNEPNHAIGLTRAANTTVCAVELFDEKLGIPVASGKVRLINTRGEARYNVTNDNGIARFSDAPFGQYALTVSHPAFLSVSRTIEFDAEHSLVRIPMYRAPLIETDLLTVVLVDEKYGLPVTDATVELQQAGGGSRTTTSDSSGRATFSNMLDGGHYHIGITHNTYMPAQRKIVFSPEQSTQRFALYQGAVSRVDARVAGIVTTYPEQGNRPVEGAVVRWRYKQPVYSINVSEADSTTTEQVSYDDSTIAAEVTTGPSGEYSVTLPLGEYVVDVIKTYDGYAAISVNNAVSVTGDMAQNFHVSGPMAPEPNRRQIEILVLDKLTREPIANARVSLSDRNGNVLSRDRADSNGLVRFTTTSTGGHLVAGNAPGYSPNAIKLLVSGTGTTGAKLELSREALPPPRAQLVTGVVHSSPPRNLQTTN